MTSQCTMRPVRMPAGDQGLESPGELSVSRVSLQRIQGGRVAGLRGLGRRPVWRGRTRTSQKPLYATLKRRHRSREREI